MVNARTEKTSTGVDWLGEIPKHWNVCSLKRVLSEPLKYGATEAGDCDDRSLPRYLRITDFDNDGGLRADTFVSLPEEIARNYYLTEGDGREDSPVPKLPRPSLLCWLPHQSLASSAQTQTRVSLLLHEIASL